MKAAHKRLLVALVTVLAITGGVVFAVRGTLFNRGDQTESWMPSVEGFLAVATPCCRRASLWDALDTVTQDHQRARAASAAEAAQWLNDWPYRSREEHDRADEFDLRVAAQSSEVRCTGAPTGPEVPRDGDDGKTLEAIRHRRECTYTKWKVWSGETAKKRRNERHTVWADDEDLFHGRVDYWD
ncbi:MAG: hypothetical protein DRH23_12975 [Deltaproteobacteria bacterium]|nr:hypothetical protein [Deltaproteobacteria bacterium]MBW2545670.1 hypothetical protein [Deltaproteobacteria bacterium]RLB46231.1 MAG: hypothetical protein DRH23_12975 [Deltaproteobacteria bacterium]